ncbi:PilZ domain-containing protein [Sphingomonas sp. F9_3S_D5_B_2]
MTGGSTADRVRSERSGGAASDRQPRRAVQLSGFGALDDGTTFGVTVLDLSYDGCKVQTSLALMPGIKLKVSMLGLGSALDATVRWYRDGRAGLEFKAEEAAQTAHAPRQEERVELAGHLSLRRLGRQHYQARLFDLTSTGCKVEFVERPKEGEVLWAKFDGLEPMEATVRWVDGYYGGLEFVRPIYAAVFDLLLRKLQG